MDENKQARAKKIFEDISDVVQKFLEKTINETIENNQVESDESKFEEVINPTMAGIAATVANYFFYLNYSKGEMLEIMCDFYQQTEDFEDEDQRDEINNKINMN
jgi:hypothetical protein